MGADFTPSLDGYTGQGAFRFWCQKVLPLVYDDSLSYYEVLCKVRDYINNLIDDVSTAESNIGSLLEAYNLLQGYVNDYFTNLDVQHEIDNKLDAMLHDGSLEEAIQPAVNSAVSQQIGGAVGAVIDDEVATQLPNVVNAQIDEAVTIPAANAADAWMAENITVPGETFVLDAGLTMANAAAPAKTVGDYCIRESTIRITTQNYASYSDADTLTVNRAYAIASSITNTHVANLPQYNSNATLLYFEGNASTRIQIYFSQSKMFYRTLNPNSAWKELAQSSALSSYATLASLNTTNSLSLQPSTPITHENWENFSNANALESNRTYSISSRIINEPNPSSDYGYVANLPAYGVGAKLSFISAGLTGRSGYQLYINVNGEFWARNTDSTGSGSWIQLAKRQYTSISGLRKYDVFCFGDSLTAGSGCSVPYHYYESIFGKYTCHNYGIGGTGYIKERGAVDDPKYDLKGTGQVGKPDSTVELLGDNNVLDYFMDNESSITSSTAIVIFAGTNDYGAQYDLNTFETAIRNTYNYILTHHTQPLIVCTPMGRVARDNETITLEQYVNKIITVCAEMKIPVIDFYHNVQIHPDITTWKNVYFADNIHPNDLGHQLIGGYYGAKLNEYLG